jgi:hypothetical protein
MALYKQLESIEPAVLLCPNEYALLNAAADAPVHARRSCMHAFDRAVARRECHGRQYCFLVESSE